MEIHSVFLTSHVYLLEDVFNVYKSLVLAQYAMRCSMQLGVYY